jgi:hypothetical protein
MNAGRTNHKYGSVAQVAKIPNPTIFTLLIPISAKKGSSINEKRTRPSRQRLRNNDLKKSIS